MKTARHIFLAVILIFLAEACGDSNERLPQQELAGLTMGTTYSVTLVALPPEIDIETLRVDVEGILLGVEHAMSTYLPDSDLTHFNMSRSTDWFGTSQMLCAAVAGAQSISEYTDGAFDVTVGPLVNLWGFGPDGSVAKPANEKLIAAAIGTVGHARLRADCTIPALRKSLPELYVDLSAYAKGYAVDRITEVLDNEGITNFLVEIGGELRLRGSNASSEKWAIAIENPSPEGRSVQSIVTLADTAVATSGDYRNFFEYDGERYSHTIDPRTGSPVSHNGASVTVVAPSAATADALATALLVMGPDDGFDFAEAENIAALFLVRADDDVEERMTTQFAVKTARGDN